MTTIYFIRHSEPYKPNNTHNESSLQLINEKYVLSVKGEKRAEILSEIEELNNLDEVISSDYARTISTAKYIANRNDKKVLVLNCFNERKFGVESWSELPDKFELKQFYDENFKMPNGESRKEVTKRMLNGLNDVLENYKDKRVAIVSHATAMLFLFLTWCEVKDNETDENLKKLLYNGKEFFDGKYFAPKIFKLEFEDKNLVNISNIKVDYGKYNN